MKEVGRAGYICKKLHDAIDIFPPTPSNHSKANRMSSDEVKQIVDASIEKHKIMVYSKSVSCNV